MMPEKPHTLTARFYAWWKAPPPADPWELEAGFQISDFTDNENILCFNCLCPTHHLNTFCSECGAPIAPYNWLHPWWRIFSYGHVVRRLVSTPIQRWVYLTVLILCIYQVTGYLLFLPAFNNLNSDWVEGLSFMLPILFVIIFQLAIAYRVTTNYYRHRSLKLD